MFNIWANCSVYQLLWTVIEYNMKYPQNKSLNQSQERVPLGERSGRTDVPTLNLSVLFSQDLSPPSVWNLNRTLESLNKLKQSFDQLVCIFVRSTHCDSLDAHQGNDLLHNFWRTRRTGHDAYSTRKQNRGSCNP